MTDPRLAAAWAERQRLLHEAARLHAEATAIRDEGNRHWAERMTLRVEANKLYADAMRNPAWAHAVRAVLGNVPMEWHPNGDCTVAGVRYTTTPPEVIPTETEKTPDAKDA